LKYLPVLNSKVQIHEGIHTGNSRDVLFHDKKINNFCKPLFYGARAGDVIKNFSSKQSKWFVDYRSEIINRNEGSYASLRDNRIFDLPKLYITRTGNPFKVFYDNNTYASNNFFSLQMKDYNLNNESILKSILPLLLSKFSNFFIRTFCAPRLGDTFIETKIFHLLAIPIPQALFDNKSTQQLLSNLVNKIIEVIKLKEDIGFLKDRLDYVIYKLYTITYEEALLIDPEFSLSQSEYDNFKIEEA
jgi:hypothetical protein